METIFKKIHEGLDLFNYYFTRHEASTSDSQREKLESDLKKEIKKLQKFRDQIKTWQGNGSLEAAIAPLKLQEHRRLVEEAMECYKDVEKNSKMKSFSNQSIMLAAKENDLIMTPEVLDALEFLVGVEEELTEQNETLEEEYEKLSQKKVRKNNMLQIEERKQELEGFKSKNEFHLDNIEAVVRYLKSGKVSVESVWTIQDDLNFYVESNQEPDFVDDDTLYDEIFKEAKQNSENNTVVSNGHPDESFEVSLNGLEDDEPTHIASEPATARKGTSSASPAPTQEQASASEIPSKPTANVTVKNNQPAGRSEVADNSTPGFVTTLKPAAAPPKPAGALKWSIAAGGAAPKSDGSNGHSATEKTEAKKPETIEVEKKAPVSKKDNRPEERASSELLSLLTKNEEYSAHLEVLKNSSLAPCELELFSDVNLLRSPPGIQKFAVAFTATNRATSECKLLVAPQKYSPVSCFMRKTYLPRDYQEGFGPQHTKLPMFLSKLQGYWNRIRASNLFNQLVKEVEILEHQKTSESTAMVNELTMVLFYGYYCGYIPMENIIAESLLHKLGWTPYGMDDGADLNPNLLEQHQHWVLQVGTSEAADVGDFRVFDLSLWEIYVKYGFKYDPRLSQSGPAKSLL